MKAKVGPAAAGPPTQRDPEFRVVIADDHRLLLEALEAVLAPVGDFSVVGVTNEAERIVSLHVESTSPYRFTVALVHNSGPYARGWYWFYDLSAKKLKSKVSSLNARIIHLERYTAGGKGRFAAVLVKNTGAAAKSWWWYYGLTAKQVNAKLKLRVAKGKPPQYARIISLDS